MLIHGAGVRFLLQLKFLSSNKLDQSLPFCIIFLKDFLQVLHFLCLLLCFLLQMPVLKLFKKSYLFNNTQSSTTASPTHPEIWMELVSNNTLGLNLPVTLSSYVLQILTSACSSPLPTDRGNCLILLTSTSFL